MSQHTLLHDTDSTAQKRERSQTKLTGQNADRDRQVTDKTHRQVTDKTHRFKYWQRQTGHRQNSQVKILAETDRSQTKLTG